MRVWRAVAGGLAVALAVVGAPAVAAEPVVNVGGKVEVASPGHLQVRVKGTAKDPDTGTGAVVLRIFVHDGRAGAAPYQRSTDANGNIDVVLPSARSGAVDVDVWAVDELPGGAVNLKSDGTPNAMPLRLTDPPINVLRDTRPPVTTITSRPEPTLEAEPGTTRDVTLTFTADEAGSTFDCNLDGAGWVPCASPLLWTVGQGDHAFEVRARDRAGNVGPAAGHRFSLVPPAPPVVPPVVVPPPPAGLEVRAAAVRRTSRLAVMVTPASAEVDYRFVVQRKAGKRWKRVARSTTRKAADRRVLDLRKGRYRVVVPAQHGLEGARSTVVRLRR